MNSVIDTLFSAFGKWDQALTCVQRAQQHAPEEVRSRPAVHQILHELVERTPAPSQRRVHQYARLIGALP